MTDTSTPIPAGWYPDPAGGPKSRWWDGTQWTEHYSEPYSPAAAAAALKAPAGTKTNTVWIWLIVVLPLLPLIGLATMDWSSLADLSSPGSAINAQVGLLTSPGYLIAVFGGWIIYGLCALFAFLDWRDLKAAGVPRPFHFAWVFLSSIVYVIGRSVVVKRRTGQGAAPMWAAIASIAISFGVAIYMMVAMFSAIFSSIPSYSGY